MNNFEIILLVLFVIILALCCAIAYTIVISIHQDLDDYTAMPISKPLKLSRRSLVARIGDAWHYWWRCDMSLRNAWERAGRVI